MTNTPARVQPLRGAAATWTTSNPTLLAGEIGYETDTLKWKIGDGTTAWVSLGYQAGSTASLSAIFSPLATFPIANYVQSGDADDTPSIVRAVAAASANGGGTVLGSSRKRIYTVSPQSSPSITQASGTTQSTPVCVAIPAGVTVDMLGATVKLGSTVGAVFANANMTTTGTRDSGVGLRNVTVDGNNLVPAVAFIALAHVTAPALDEVYVTNGQYQGIYGFDVDRAKFGRIGGSSFTGQPVTFGTPVGTNNDMRDSRIEHVTVSTVTQYNTGSQPGNGFAGVYTRCLIGTIETRNCAAGIKIQGPGSDTHVETALLDTCGNSTTSNSGFKFQGDSTNGWYPTRMSVGRVIARNQYAQGLYLELSVDCTVSTYVGEGNNIGNTGPDVWIGGTRDRVLTVKSDSAGGDGVLIRAYATDYQLGSVTVRNPGQNAASTAANAISVAGGSGTIDNVVLVDDQSTPTMKYGLGVYSTSAVVDVKKRRIAGYKSGGSDTNITAGATVNLNDVGVGNNYAEYTTAGSFNFTVPLGITSIRFRCVAGGGGGGGGGSALTSGGVTNQTGGGGGGVGNAAEGALTVTPGQVLPLVVGAGGTAGVGGALNGNAGTAGGQGGNSTINTTAVRSGGGGGGAGSALNSGTTVGGGYPGRTGFLALANVPGFGGQSNTQAFQVAPGMTPGGGGGSATATLGGGGGAAITTVFPSGFGASNGSSGASTTTAGVAGTAATSAGSGGGGGGGGAPGGAGGNGGAGAPGIIQIWW